MTVGGTLRCWLCARFARAPHPCTELPMHVLGTLASKVRVTVGDLRYERSRALVRRVPLPHLHGLVTEGKQEERRREKEGERQRGMDCEPIGIVSTYTEAV